jgi:hypothetical protein
LQGGGDGRRAGGPAPPTSSVGMPASDIDSMGGEDESETTGQKIEKRQREEEYQTRGAP